MACPDGGETILASLSDQLTAYRRLIMLCRQKQEYLVGGDLARLEAILPKEQEALAQLTAAEHAYIQACDGFCRRGGIPYTHDHARLVGAMPGSTREEATELMGGLAKAVGELMALVQSNGELIRRARNFIDLTLQQASGRAPRTVYDDSGSRTPDATANTMSRQA